jgi:ligand-binding sensor domain-containing protein
MLFLCLFYLCTCFESKLFASVQTTSLPKNNQKSQNHTSNANEQQKAQQLAQPLPAYLRQPYRFYHINTENGGLSQNTVFAALQDRKGFLWIATGDGLNRYDGHSCKVFRHNPGDSTTISAHQVFSILEDSDGNIWCGTAKEINRYIPQTGTFERYYNQVLGTKSPSQFALNMFEDTKKRLWVCTGAGLFYLDKKTKAFIPASQLDSSGKVFDKQYCQRLHSSMRKVFLMGFVN